MQHSSPSLGVVTTPAVAPHRVTLAAGGDKQLTRLVQTAWRRVPFYSKHWRGIAARLPSMRFPEHLSEIPLVQKADLLVQKAEDLLDPSFRDNRLTTEKTSGSSGQPMEIHKDPASVRRRSLRFLRALLGCGYRPGQRFMLISTRRSGGLMSFARWHYVDLRDEHLLEEYQRVRPEVLYGPLSSLLQICEHAQRAAIPLHRPAVVISTAEQLMPAQREILDAAFKAPVADFYGMTEVGLVAYRRPHAASFELASPDLMLEFLPLTDDHSTERLVVTDLTGGAMPLIRYDTGDLVCRSMEGQQKVISGFVGRRVDSIKLAAGNAVSPYRITTRLEAVQQLRQYQVVQRKDLSLDIYFHSAERDTDTIRQDISTALRELCGELPARIHYQKHALHRVAGKFRPVQSEARSDA